MKESIKKYCTYGVAETNKKSIKSKLKFVFYSMYYGGTKEYQKLSNVISYLEGMESLYATNKINGFNQFTPLVELVQRGRNSFKRIPFKLDEILDEIIEMANEQEHCINVGDFKEAKENLAHRLVNKRFFEDLNQK